ncbi:uncharacterized protein METZ01_LOCUS177080, partial [marine metagenome]
MIEQLFVDVDEQIWLYQELGFTAIMSSYLLSELFV